MTTIGNLLSPETRERLGAALSADLDLDAPAKARKLTTADAIDIDPRSGAMIEAPCVDCKTTILIDPKVPDVLAADHHLPRVPICLTCAERRIIEAIQDQRNVEAIRRTTVAKHTPRLTDGEDHPVTTTTKENDMDLDNLSDAALGAKVRSSMKTVKAEKVKKGAKKVKKERAKAAKQALEQRAEGHAQRKASGVLPAFMVGLTLEVPALDLTDVPSLDEAPSAKERSPYNKARFRLTKEAALDPEDCTYRVLASEHKRLMSLAADKNEAHAEEEMSERAASAIVDIMLGDKAMRTEPKEAEPKQIMVDLDPDVKAKVKALAELTGISKKKAREIVLASL